MNSVCYNFAALVLCLMLGALSGCSYLGVESPFANDPLTGGINTQTSALLNAPLPSGLQVYPTHGFSHVSSSGVKEGMEVFRGNIDIGAASLSMFNTLKQQGWQLRMSVRKGYRSVYLYQKNGEYALLKFYRQGMLAILEIWSGASLPDNAVLSMQREDYGDTGPSFAGEEYGPSDGSGAAEKRGTVEQWGGNGGIEERAL